jgi:hypothetical protein
LRRFRPGHHSGNGNPANAAISNARSCTGGRRDARRFVATATMASV